MIEGAERQGNPYVMSVVELRSRFSRSPEVVRLESVKGRPLGSPVLGNENALAACTGAGRALFA